MKRRRGDWIRSRTALSSQFRPLTVGATVKLLSPEGVGARRPGGARAPLDFWPRRCDSIWATQVGLKSEPGGEEGNGGYR